MTSEERDRLVRLETLHAEHERRISWIEKAFEDKLEKLVEGLARVELSVATRNAASAAASKVTWRVISAVAAISATVAGLLISLIGLVLRFFG